MPRKLREIIRDEIASSGLLRAGFRRKLGHTFLGRDPSVESLFLDNFYAAFSLKDQNRLLASPPDTVYDNYLHYWNARPDDALLPRMLYADQKTYLVELLMKQDQMSMAASIESRVPFLDHQFVEFAARIPGRLKIRGHTQKYILKRAVEDLLPHHIVYRKKMGFPTPVRQWLMAPDAAPVYGALTAKDSFTASILNRTELDSLIARHHSGVEDATDRIWRLLNLQIWADIFLTGNRERWWDGILPAVAA